MWRSCVARFPLSSERGTRISTVGSEKLPPLQRARSRSCKGLIYAILVTAAFLAVGTAFAGVSPSLSGSVSDSVNLSGATAVAVLAHDIRVAADDVDR